MRTDFWWNIHDEERLITNRMIRRHLTVVPFAEVSWKMNSWFSISGKKSHRFTIISLMQQKQFEFNRTCLRSVREHEMLPKTSIRIGCWARAMNIGSICHNSTGNRYQSSCVMVWLISSNALLNWWPSSQASIIGSSELNNCQKIKITSIE